MSDDPNFGGLENLGVAPVPAGSAGPAPRSVATTT